jgi:hypothetical protein
LDPHARPASLVLRIVRRPAHCRGTPLKFSACGQAVSWEVISSERAGHLTYCLLTCLFINFCSCFNDM